MKHYLKNKPIKQGFKYWYRCDSETGQDYHLELCQGQKEKRELIVVLDLCQVLKDTYCQVFFDNFFNSPSLIQKLHNNGLHGVGTARSDIINMPQMKKDKEMKQRDY